METVHAKEQKSTVRVSGNTRLLIPLALGVGIFLGAFLF